MYVFSLPRVHGQNVRECGKSTDVDDHSGDPRAIWNCLACVSRSECNLEVKALSAIARMPETQTTIFREAPATLTQRECGRARARWWIQHVEYFSVINVL